MWSHGPLQDPGEGMEPLFPGLFRGISSSSCWQPPPDCLPPCLWEEGLGVWPGLGTHTHIQPHTATQAYTALCRVTWAHTAHSHRTVPPIHSHALAATHTPQKSPADICCPSQAPALESPIAVQPPFPARPADSLVASPLPNHPTDWATVPGALQTPVCPPPPGPFLLIPTPTSSTHLCWILQHCPPRPT